MNLHIIMDLTRGAPTAENFRSFLCSTFSWRTHRGKLSLVFSPNLFVACVPRKTFAHFCAQPFRGVPTAENFCSILRPTFPWRAHPGNHSPNLAPNLSLAHTPRQPLTPCLTQR